MQVHSNPHPHGIGLQRPIVYLRCLRFTDNIDKGSPITPRGHSATQLQSLLTAQLLRVVLTKWQVEEIADIHRFRRRTWSICGNRATLCSPSREQGLESKFS